MAEPSWPAAVREPRPWRQAVRGGNREDRTLDSVEVVLPPLVAHRAVPVHPSHAAEAEVATREIMSLELTHGEQLGALGTLLLRTESVASSKIEQIEARLDDYARALHGGRANSSASAMVAATEALEVLMRTASADRPIKLSGLHDAHHALMDSDPHERAFAGRPRAVQNWVGGSDHSPRGALFVPPPPDTLDSYLADLVAFVNRTDLPSLVQAAVAHAQFETIHPYTDGNGRIGRALINAILRRRSVTTDVVVPIASALVAERDRYFAALDAYRDGDPGPVVGLLVTATRIAAAESRVTAHRLAAIPGLWRSDLGPVRRGSAVDTLIDLLPRHPVLQADDVVALTGASSSSAYAALERLRDASVIRPLTERRREQVWGAGLVLDELDELNRRIATAVAAGRLAAAAPDTAS